MKTLLLIPIFCLTIITGVSAQDSIKVESSLSIETKGTGQLVNGRKNIECIGCFFETIHDNPFHHFALYSGITHTLSVNDAFHFETGIYLEERSFSGGSNTINNWVVYPKIFLTGSDTLEVLKKAISYKISGGDFWNEDFDDMLRLHNLDYQGLVGELSFKDYTLGVLIVGDLSVNVGLGLHQCHKFYVRKELKKLRTTFYLSENKLTDYDRHIVPKDYNLGSNIQFKAFKNIELESQFELRINNESGNSFAGGIGLSGEFKTLKFAGRAKYYQADFNLGYTSSKSLYRDGAKYVGEQLYPLKNFFRTNSQWGNYTKYQNRDLLGFELNLNWEKNIKKPVAFFTDIDLNIIGNPETRTGYTIPLYSVGLRSNSFGFLKTEIFFTNKHMNLNTFYQTFQASKVPFFGGSVILNIDKIPLRTIYLR